MRQKQMRRRTTSEHQFVALGHTSNRSNIFTKKCFPRELHEYSPTNSISLIPTNSEYSSVAPHPIARSYGMRSDGPRNPFPPSNELCRANEFPPSLTSLAAVRQSSDFLSPARESSPIRHRHTTPRGPPSHQHQSLSLHPAQPHQSGVVAAVVAARARDPLRNIRRAQQLGAPHHRFTIFVIGGATVAPTPVFVLLRQIPGGEMNPLEREAGVDCSNSSST